MTQLRLLACLLYLALSGCTTHLFSGDPKIDRSRPVAVVDIRGQASRLAATTDEGIVFLDKSTTETPCRVHYFLGPDLIVDDGIVEPLGGVYSRANIDLKTQAVPTLKRELTADDRLVALLLVGRNVVRLDVSLTKHSAVKGYAIDWPGQDLPEGTGIFTHITGVNERGLAFVGLATGIAKLNIAGDETKFITFTGPARMREAMANAKPVFQKHKVIHRPDGITISR